MRFPRPRLVLPAIALSIACSSAAPKSGEPAVQVYGTSAPPGTESGMPEGCRLIERTGSHDEQESERAADDPYRRERRTVAAKGGNVLLVYTQPLILRPNLDCAPGDKTPPCLATSQSWYRVSFGYYACSPQAADLLARRVESAPTSGPLFSWKLARSRTGVAQLKARILSMMQEGVGTDVIVAWVRGQRLKQKLTPEDIIDWKKAGIDERVIRAALES
jgi:hypothetical protein